MTLPIFIRVYLTSFGNVTKASIVALKTLRELAEKNNIERIELGFPYPIARVKDFSSKVKKEIKDIVGSFKTTCHTPMVNLASLNERKRQENLREMIESIEFSLEKGINQFVIHLAAAEMSKIPFFSWFKRGTADKINIELIRKTGEKSFLEIKDYFGKDKLIYGLENLTIHEPAFRDPKEFKHLFSKNVGLTLDTVHAVSWGLDPVELIEIYKKHLVEVHLTDGVGKGKIVKHYALGEGKVPLVEVIQRLQEIEFKGPVIIEVESKKDFPKSLKWLKKIANI